LVPVEQRPAEKQKLASIISVSESAKLDPDKVSGDWDNVRAAYAEKVGGEFLEARHDDAAFSAKLAARLTKQRDERHLLAGLDDAKAPGAKEAWEKSLDLESAGISLQGRDLCGRSERMAGRIEGETGLRPERVSAYAEAARKTHETMAASVAKVRPIAGKVYTSLAQDRDLQGGAPVESPAVLMRGLSPEEKNLGVSNGGRSVGQGRRQGRGCKRRGRRCSGAWRTWESQAAARTAFRAQLLRTINSRPATRSRTAERDGSEIRSAVRNSESMEAASGGESWGGRGVDGANAFFGKPQRKLTAEEAAKRGIRTSARRSRIWTRAEQARKFAHGHRGGPNEQRRVGGSFKRRCCRRRIRSRLLASACRCRRAWVPAMEAFGASRTRGDEYSPAIGRKAWMSPGRPFELSLRSLDLRRRLSTRPKPPCSSKAFPALGKALERFALGGRVGARFAANFAGTVAAETAIELVQDHVIPAAVQDNLATDPQFDVHWAEIWHEAAKDAPETALGMVLLSALGGALQTREQSTAARELSLSRAAMRLRGYTLDQIAEIQTAPANERGTLLAQYLPATAPTGEEQAALVADAKAFAKIEKAAFEEKSRADAASASEAADYTVRVTRDAAGWAVHMANGEKIEVNSADAAVKIRDDLKQASTQAEASALVAIIDTWHEKAGSEDRQTTLTGETARSDGSGITYTRDGEVTREIKDSAALDTLRKEAQMDAKLSGNEDIDVIVNGSNSVEFRERVGEGARDVIQRLELNLSDSSALTALHEQAEASWRTAVARGTITLEETRKGVAAVAGALDPAQARDESEREFRERVQRVARGEGTDADVRETVSELAVADAIGRRKDGGAMPAGAVTTAIDAAIRNATDAAEVRTLGKLRAFIRAAKQYFRGVLGTVAALKKAKRGEGAADFETLMSKVLGFDEQARHDGKLAGELADSIPDYIPPTPEEMEAGIAFSLSKPKEHPELFGPLEGETREEYARRTIGDLIEINGLKDIREPYVISTTDGEIDEVFDNEQGAREHLSQSAIRGDWLWRANRTSGEAVLLGGVAEREPDGPVNPRAGALYGVIPARAQTKAEAGALPRKTPFGRKFGGQQGEVTFYGERQGPRKGPAFRLSPGKRLELIQKRIDSALSRDPEQRRALGKRAMDKVSKLQYEWETERMTPRGDVIRPVEEKRRKAELDREQGVRQALREAELVDEGMSKLSASEQAAYSNGLQRLAESNLVGAMLGSHGKLVSRTRAEREGKQSEYDDVPWLPPQWYATKGGLMPDEMAQALANDGLLKDGYPDTLWTALASEIQTIRNNNAAWEKASEKVKEIERQAKNQAREEMHDWRHEEDKKQREDWNPKTRLVRDLRTLDAILSVLPAELRGKVGGFVKLATLGSDEARAKEINRRIDKLAVLVEKHLQTETTAALYELQKKAEPDREAGKRRAGRSAPKRTGSLTRLQRFGI
jgi:hypothetical protein